ncbi:hypothetical protein RRG08_060368 [Elysia crispata]|uniref:Uncharacterized protein n=1 Tax=Elysia crispata TaxID=231223 RepID=A0AAE1DFS7_9GAST|nr:hypothetical protein RRG08_060368 [Elysia crispata]
MTLTIFSCHVLIKFSVASKQQNVFGDALRWYVPQGIKAWMNARGCQNVVELSWWDEHIHSPESGFKMVATPCQHWCKRTATDTNKFYLEPKTKLAEEAAKQGLKKDEFVTVSHGEIRVFGAENQQ